LQREFFFFEVDFSFLLQKPLPLRILKDRTFVSGDETLGSTGECDWKDQAGDTHGHEVWWGRYILNEGADYDGSWNFWKGNEE